jgi:hypothetical protein
MTPDPIIGRVLFTDGIVRPVFLDGGGSLPPARTDLNPRLGDPPRGRDPARELGLWRARELHDELMPRPDDWESCDLPVYWHPPLVPPVDADGAIRQPAGDRWLVGDNAAVRWRRAAEVQQEPKVAPPP